MGTILTMEDFTTNRARVSESGQKRVSHTNLLLTHSDIVGIMQLKVMEAVSEIKKIKLWARLWLLVLKL